MKAKSYKLKHIPTAEQLIKLGARSGCSWISKDSELYFSVTHDFPNSAGEFTIYVCFPDFEKGLAEWDDFNFVLVLDDDFGQPYTLFYGVHIESQSYP